MAALEHLMDTIWLVVETAWLHLQFYTHSSFCHIRTANGRGLIVTTNGFVAPAIPFPWCPSVRQETENTVRQETETVKLQYNTPPLAEDWTRLNTEMQA